MGVVQRQSIKQSLVNYLAVAVAAISTIFIYPQDKETYGMARFIIDTSLMLAPFIMLGFSAVTIRFFPDFKEEQKGHRGFLFFLISVILVGSVIFALLAFAFKGQFYALYEEKPAIYQRYLPYLIPIAILLAFFQLFYNYSSNFKRIAVPAVFQNLIKVSLPVLILLFIWGNIDQDQLVNGILINYIIALLGIIAYVYWLGQLKLQHDFSLLTKNKIKDIRSFAFFSLFSSVGSVLAFRIDLFMVPTLLDFKNNGIYAIALFIGNAIAIPTNAIGQITAPIVTESLKEGDLKDVKELYQSSSINLLIVGLLLFICILASVEDLFAIMPKSDDLRDGAVIVFLIGLAKVIDMGTSINNQIINYSKHYRFGFYAIVLMAVFNITANLVLIPKYGIIGAAAATLLSLSIYNLAKLVFIQWRFGMQPFTLKTLWVILIAMVVCGIGMAIPATQIELLDILIRSIVMIGIFVPVVLYFNISKEFKQIVLNLIERIRNVRR